ncbi:MAG: hypothetical protein FWC21_02805 [Treponema sp.]|nr:hypothetical protein [Treponema sp.]
MKKLLISMFILICIFITSCVMDTITYCPYCSSSNISHKSEPIYQCGNCNKQFGAMDLSK